MVPCNHNTPVCECTVKNDICEFQFDIEMLQTFTRYVLNNDGDLRGTAGAVWHIVNGQWKPANRKKPGNCGTKYEDKTCTKPFGVDGYTFRSFIAVNGQIPGPTLIVPHNKLVKVNVINRLASESISIHWHGMHQRGSNWMDGVEHITQCGIPPGASFTYIFKADPYGTHWYHSHSGAQRTDGLFGALIVKEEPTPTLTIINQVNEILSTTLTESNFKDLPEQHTLTLLDWQKSSSIDLFTQIHSSIRYFDIDAASKLSGSGIEPDRAESSDGAEIGPVPYWSGLINGKGRHQNVDYRNTKLSQFNVEASKAGDASNVYRFRLIGAQSLYAYRFSIEEHKLIVIATDGQFVKFVKPTEVDYIIIHSGERYDFLLNADRGKTKEDYFMIRAVTLDFNQTSNYKQENSAEAILSYEKSEVPSSSYEGIATRSKTVKQRCTGGTKCKALNCPFKNFPSEYNIDCFHITNLQLLTDYSEELPKIADDNYSRLFFNFAFEGASQTSAVNARNLKLPSAALALLDEEKLEDIKVKEFCDLEDNDICNRNSDIIGLIAPECYCTHVVNASANKDIELVLSAIGPQPMKLDNFRFAHPVHLHGHYFHVVKMGFGDYENGRLTAANSDIDCGGDKLCTNPSWKPNSEFKTQTNENTIDPKAPLKDTLLIPAGGYAVVYFKADNPGWWFLHCHIEVHQLEGMGVIIDEGNDDDKTLPPSGMNQCGNFSITPEEFNAAVTVTVSMSSPSPRQTVTVVIPTSTINPKSFKAYQISNYIFLSLFVIVLALFIPFAVLCVRGTYRSCWNDYCCCKCCKCCECCECCKIDEEYGIKKNASTPSTDAPPPKAPPPHALPPNTNADSIEGDKEDGIKKNASTPSTDAPPPKAPPPHAPPPNTNADSVEGDKEEVDKKDDSV